MNYGQLKSCFIGPVCSKHLHSIGREKRYAISNEFGHICFVWARNEQDALDMAVDSGKLDCQAMSEEDHAEYEANGWDDSFILAGNASEPFRSEYLNIREI